MFLTVVDQPVRVTGAATRIYLTDFPPALPVMFDRAKLEAQKVLGIDPTTF